MTGAAKNLLDALTAIAAGYNVSVRDDRYICVENPEYRPDWGNNPSIVIDVEEVRKFLGSSDRAMVSSNPFAPAPAVPEGWRDALEHVTELLVDTWHHQMDGDPEEHIAVKDARALLATLPLSVPEGWVLVPKEPTREMAIAAAKALDDITVDDPKAAAWDAMRAYRAMLSAAPTPPVDDGWRPIETAPKDGTDVLLWDGEEIFVGYWSDSIWVSPGAWVKEEHRSDTVTYIPTHWMPIPAAPTEARDE